MAVSDLVFKNILLHIETLIVRAKDGKYLLSDVCTSTAEASPFRKLADHLCDWLSERYAVELPAAEREYLAAIIAARTKIVNSDQLHQDCRRIQTILAKLDDEFLTDFQHDPELCTALELHTAPLLNRLYFNMQLQNPLIEDISLQFANVISIAVRFAELLENFSGFELSRDEIGFVALHFASYFERRRETILKRVKRVALIGDISGGATSLLKVKLESVFINAQIIAVAANQLDILDNELPDIFLSTIPTSAPRYHGIPVISICQFLNDTEIQRIKELSSLYLDITGFNSSVLQIQHLFRKELFLRSDGRDYLDLLRQQAQKVSDAGLAGPEFSDSVIEREIRFSTIYPNGVAGPHALSSQAIEDCISVTILNKPILYQEQPVQLIFLINLKPGHLFLHKEISEFISCLIDNDAARRALLQCRNYEDFIKQLNCIETHT